MQLVFNPDRGPDGGFQGFALCFPLPLRLCFDFHRAQPPPDPTPAQSGHLVGSVTCYHFAPPPAVPLTLCDDCVTDPPSPPPASRSELYLDGDTIAERAVTELDDDLDQADRTLHDPLSSREEEDEGEEESPSAHAQGGGGAAAGERACTIPECHCTKVAAAAAAAAAAPESPEAAGGNVLSFASSVLLDQLVCATWR